jgi:hypothetical protein
MKTFLAGLSLILLLAGGSARADWRDHPSYPMFRDVIEGDLHAKSDARLDRASSKLIQAWEKSGDCGCTGELPGMFEVGLTDVVIVKSYEILGVQETVPGKVVWRVAYEALAAFYEEKDGLRLEIYAAPVREVVDYPLIREAQWVFEDFSPPRILLKDAIEAMGQRYRGGPNEEPFYVRPERQDTLAGKSIKAEHELFKRLKTLALP